MVDCIPPPGTSYITYIPDMQYDQRGRQAGCVETPVQRRERLALMYRQRLPLEDWTQDRDTHSSSSPSSDESSLSGNDIIYSSNGEPYTYPVHPPPSPSPSLSPPSPNKPTPQSSTPTTQRVLRRRKSMLFAIPEE